MSFPTSISMQLVTKFDKLDLVSIDWDHVVLRDYREYSTDAHEATIVVKINLIEHRRDIVVPVIRSGECRVDIVERSPDALVVHQKQNAKAFVMACDGRVTAEEAEEIAERHIQDSIGRNDQ